MTQTNRQRLWYLENRERILKDRAIYREKNRERIREGDLERRRNKPKNVYHRLCMTCEKEFETDLHNQVNCDEHINKKSLKEKEYRRKYMLKRNFGITLEQYNELLEKQNYSCAVCLKHESQFKTKLAVDHNHTSGEIRGLLCNHCNHRIIGRHKDSELFYRAAKYLDNTTGWFVPEKFKKSKRKRKKTKW